MNRSLQPPFQSSISIVIYETNGEVSLNQVLAILVSGRTKVSQKVKDESGSALHLILEIPCFRLVSGQDRRDVAIEV